MLRRLPELVFLLSILICTPVGVRAATMPSQETLARTHLLHLEYALKIYRDAYGVYPQALSDDRLPAELLTNGIGNDRVAPQFDTYKRGELEYIWNYPEYSVRSGKWILQFCSMLLPIAAWFIVRKKRRCNVALTVSISSVPFAILFVLPAALAMISPVAVWSIYTPNENWTSSYMNYNYASGDDWWILQSVGPNGIRDVEELTWRVVPTVPEQEFLIRNTYDPTNGAKSAGDLFRTQDQVGW